VAHQIEWVNITPGNNFFVGNSPTRTMSLSFKPVSLSPHFPSYVSQERCSQFSPQEGSLGLIVESDDGARLAYFPSVPEIDKALLKQVDSVSVLLMDGTFWSDDELIKVRGAGPTARQIGHVPISGERGTLRELGSTNVGR